MGTSWTLCARFCAVTMISSMVVAVVSAMPKTALKKTGAATNLTIIDPAYLKILISPSSNTHCQS